MPDDTRPFARQVAANVRPVRPLPYPWIRTAIWCGVSLPVVGVIVFLMSQSGDAAWAQVDRRVILQQLAALATAVTAAAAAFASTVPGYPHRCVLFIPLVPLAIWLADLGQWCVQESLVSGFTLWSFIGQWGCLPTTPVASALPAAIIVTMLRRAAPLTPRLTTALSALAAGGLGIFGVRFVHAADSSVGVLVWHFSAVLILAALSAPVGRSVFNWQQLAGQNHGVASR